MSGMSDERGDGPDRGGPVIPLQLPGDRVTDAHVAWLDATTRVSQRPDVRALLGRLARGERPWEDDEEDNSEGQEATSDE